MWRHCWFQLEVPIHEDLDPVEHMTKLLTPLLGDDFTLTLVRAVSVREQR